VVVTITPSGRPGTVVSGKLHIGTGDLRLEWRLTGYVSQRGGRVQLKPRSCNGRALLDRRRMLTGAGAAWMMAALDGCRMGVRGGPRTPVPTPATPAPAAAADTGAAAGTAAPGRLQLAPLHASTDRITVITVCTRPFRAQGPRLDVEPVGRKIVVHNYGHGGSGWSLSWGSSGIAVQKALATGAREIAVIGCGALGLTSGLLLQRAGARVTLYAKDLPPNVRSSLASGLWTPDSRICLEDHATPAFKQLWAGMARQSFQTYQTLLGLAGTPVEFIDSYFVTDDPRGVRRHGVPTDTRPKFAELQHELIPDLIPRSEDFGPGTHPFGERYLHRGSTMMFNLSAYARLLMADFLANGGRIEIAEFRTPEDFGKLRERTLINATGYGARALFGDESVTPVRGQLARMIPQPDVNYGLFYKGVSFVPRRDGLVFQAVGEDDYYGFSDATTLPDRAEAELAVNTIAGLYRTA
jgi:glycine/D-amino acid oxidase-like deaminating enzyme